MDTVMVTDMSGFLQEQAAQAPDDIKEFYYAIEDLHERRLWKQLTDVLIKFFDDPKSLSSRYALFFQFVDSFHANINQLKYAYMGLKSIESCSNEEALKSLEAIKQRIDKEKSIDAFVYTQCAIARVKLVLGDSEAALDILTSISKIIDKFDYVEGIINAAYYSVSADYYKSKGDFAQFYRHCLLYISCIDLGVQTGQELLEKAIDLSVAAVLGEIYNFGDLILHPVFEKMVNTEFQWLHDLVIAMNAGNLKEFEALVGHVHKLPLLKDAIPFLGQKIRLLALLELVFQLSPSQRLLSFKTIAETTRIPTYEVELLVMRALSLGLIDGEIDQVAEIVRISSVQSRILNKEQIANMETRLREWSQGVKNLSRVVETSSKGVIV
ncbi:19S proteasome regulatory subunit Rpn9 [Schizosaccharomyces japonicus yFS275]|uniref:19S proteasome regulatory subunit Rpn9 n=1 Tax=Schizosaccharomyces japonicus (strain yFS275 / FY16936) TaxID=402676 RepID=B6K455_SCHJY|nr:19S proteasome regulatory subunit Rpn9 [Schizosaccharomyces japonicus yFS275]EEB08262.1 19S proteasome regulatory subunit Rpn9 [Schizosaccharomyces japonicus yFS275]